MVGYYHVGQSPTYIEQSIIYYLGQLPNNMWLNVNFKS